MKTPIYLYDRYCIRVQVRCSGCAPIGCLGEGLSDSASGQIVRFLAPRNALRGLRLTVPGGLFRLGPLSRVGFCESQWVSAAFRVVMPPVTVDAIGVVGGPLRFDPGRSVGRRMWCAAAVA